MINEAEVLTSDETAIVFSQFLANSKIISLFNNLETPFPLAYFKVGVSNIGVYNKKSNHLFFTSTTKPDLALDMFFYIRKKYLIHAVEGSRVVISEIDKFLKTEIGLSLSVCELYIMSKPLILESESDLIVRNIVEGNDLIELGAPTLISAFAAERLNSLYSEDKSVALIKSKTRHFFGLNVSGSIVSIGAWIREASGYGCISYIYTATEHRGKGYCKTLLKHVLEHAQSRYRGAFLFVEKDNAPAINLYSDLSFSKDDEITQLKLEMK
mgnify:FL=1|tara:strand:+ start:253 stop:1059 length:807 start_codon:yes stop_codon:yes gene_type:complete